MKKIKNRRKAKVNILALIIISVVLFLVFQILYFFQANIFPLIPIAGVVPNLFIIFILVIGLYGNNFLAMFYGIVCGIWIDTLYGEVIGITPAMLCLIGFIATWFDTLWSKDEKISIIIMIVLSTLFFEFGSYFIKSIVLEFDLELVTFFKILLWEELYNVLITIIFFSVIKKLGYIMERKLKRNNMYTVEL
ncbi:MAG: rod shape-determining protein MreD [Clostridia bacterium]|nr:rod shape-determining protein MreD [Clostridia bacterium]